MTTKILSFEIENLKRVKAITLQVTQKGLTVLGGRNAQGKTSALDGILWALGGNKRRPSNPKRDGAMNAPRVKLTLANGYVVERKGEKGSLTVTDPAGNHAGQQLLDSFVSQFAIDLPKFLNLSTKEKAKALLQTLGIGDTLDQFDREEERLYADRTAIGRIADAKEKYSSELPEYPDAPEEPVSASALIKQQQAILAQNGENARQRMAMDANLQKKTEVEATIARLKQQLAENETWLAELNKAVVQGQKTTAQLEDASTAAIEQNLEQIESINAAVAANHAKAVAADEAAEQRAVYDDLTAKIAQIRLDRLALLENANLPLPGLTVDEGELVYNAQKWDGMSSSEQLRVSVAICKAMAPDFGFVLMDQLEKMDIATMTEFGQWLEEQDLQVIGTRVTSNPDECTIIIEDGLPLGSTYIEEVTNIKEPKQQPPSVVDAAADDDDEGF